MLQYVTGIVFFSHSLLKDNNKGIPNIKKTTLSSLSKWTLLWFPVAVLYSAFRKTPDLVHSLWVLPPRLHVAIHGKKKSGSCSMKPLFKVSGWNEEIGSQMRSLKKSEILIWSWLFIWSPIVLIVKDNRSSECLS